MVGGGLAGLSVALELARRGRQVTLLEGSRIAWGASGRNGGSVSPAFSAGADAIRRHVDEDHYRALYRLSMEGVEIIRANIRDLDIRDAHRSTAACAWCATTPATRCSAGAMNSSGFSSATCACCAPSCASGW